MTEPTASKAKTSGVFLIEGLLTELHVASGKEKRLAQVDLHYRSNQVITGLGTLVGDVFGQATAAARVAMHEDDDAENFLCLIGDTVVCGTFGGASQLPASETFRVPGFADPENVNLNNYQYGIVHGRALRHSQETRASNGNIHCHKKALADGKIRMVS